VDNRSAAERVCVFQGGVPTKTVVVALHPYQDAGGFAQQKATLNSGGQPTSDLGGIGDQAYASLLQSRDKTLTIATLVARKGTFQVLIKAPTTLAPVENLMQLVLSRA
jgi:hypothetical protein